jgi:hypothetical protein
MTHGTYAGTGDEPHYLAIAHSLAFDGDLDVGNNYGVNEPLIGEGSLEPEAHVRLDAHGIARPVHDVGMPLLFAPFVRIARPVARWLANVTPPSVMVRARLTPSVLYRHLISLGMIALATMLAGLIFDALVGLGASVRTAFGTALLLMLSPPLLIFSILFFTELPSALLCLVAFRQICLSPRSGERAWILAGVATGALFLLHAKNIGLVIPLTLLTFFRNREPGERRGAVAFACGLVPMLALRTAVNYWLWGTLLTSAHARLSASVGLGEAGRETAIRLTGWLVDQEFGLLIYAPVYLLALPGMIALMKTRRDLALGIVAVVACYVALIAWPMTNVHGWTGGWNPAARFLTPIVPLLGLAVSAGLRVVPRALAAAVVAVQVLISAYAWQHPKVLWNDGDGRAAVCSAAGASVCEYLPSVVRPGQDGIGPAEAGRYIRPDATSAWRSARRATS